MYDARSRIEELYIASARIVWSWRFIRRIARFVLATTFVQAKHSSLSNDIVRTQSGLSSLSMHSFNKDIGDLCTELQSNMEKGLDPDFAAERRKAEGPNAL